MSEPIGYDEWFRQVERLATAYELEINEVLAAVKLLTVRCYNLSIRDLASWHNTHEYVQYIMGGQYLKISKK